ncbi:SLC13 family permease [Arthrobacter psychrochitiniphilus]|uniref:Arsenic transporter n=1 Tax=Arthrobacter psychrochitiniphilus TaxID=291045 RepID=A0A2V3DSV6_9MICC|nr:SLC13 family permease [Arthrobacter psychrochitiniphilus]NYG18794.1 Na+/H+ antiporter NhaD/arsenite permease-like protein [Arthrobacter psychrochitiniphilus]PXA66288.1 arsenic transporter [Arthrobacter psychrochitiniphilus]
MSGAVIKKLASAIVPPALFTAGLILIANGTLSRGSAGELFERTVPILLFVAAMTIVTELADNAGLFRIITAWLARLGTCRGRGRSQAQRSLSGRVMTLWLLVVVLAALSTVFLSLDTTAVLVTPVVVTLARHARIHPLPFALTTVWLANTASLFLPVSNLTNLLARQQLDIGLAGFLQLMWAPALVGIVAPLAFLLVWFRKDFKGSYTAPEIPAETDKPLLLISGATVALLLPALVSGVPVAIPASIAACFLVAVFIFRRRSALRLRMIPFQPLLLTMGLFMLVAALHDHGLGAALARISGSGNDYLSLLQLAGLGMASANGFNNLPAYLALEPTAGSAVRLAAVLIGVNLGPLVSPWASLATLLWHGRLKSMGINISWTGYALAGAVLLLPLIPAAVLALWLSSGMPG